MNAAQVITCIVVAPIAFTVGTLVVIEWLTAGHELIAKLRARRP